MHLLQEISREKRSKMRFAVIVLALITAAALYNSKYTEVFQQTLLPKGSKTQWQKLVKLSIISPRWDNNNFLESLGQGRSTMTGTNNEYHKMCKKIVDDQM
eukprot:7584539-Ditylum_brightwellii.AAC.1